MSLVARRQPHLPGLNRQTMVAAAMIVAIAALGSGALFAGSRLGGQHGYSGPPQRGAAVVMPTPTPSASPSATPTPTPEPSATPTLAPPPSALATLTCTIAVAGRWAPGSGGFLSFPGGQFRADAESNVRTPTQEFWGLSHSLALNRWLPVPRDWMTPEGRRYVYPAWGSYLPGWGEALHVVDASGSVTFLPLPQAGPATGPRTNTSWRVLIADEQGVYVAPETYGGISGLWLVGYNRQITRIAPDLYWQAVSYPYAYGTLTPSVPEGANNTLVRLDMRTGTRADVFSQPGLAASVFGFAADGTPVVQGRHGEHTYEIWLASATHPVKLLTVTDDTVTTGGGGQGGGMGPGYPGVPGLSAIGDSHGLWIATTKGLYLYTQAAGVEKASDLAGPLGSTCR